MRLSTTRTSSKRRITITAKTTRPTTASAMCMRFTDRCAVAPTSSSTVKASTPAVAARLTASETQEIRDSERREMEWIHERSCG